MISINKQSKSTFLFSSVETRVKEMIQPAGAELKFTVNDSENRRIWNLQLNEHCVNTFVVFLDDVMLV